VGVKLRSGGQRELAGFTRPTGREVGLLLAVGCLVLAVSLAALGPSSWRIGLLGEWVTYLLLALALISWQPLRLVLAATSRLQRTAVVAGLLLLALGQFVGGGRQTFPLVRFQMFTDPAASTLRQYHYLGHTSSGAGVPVDPVALYPSLDRGRFEGKLVRTAEAALQDGPRSEAARTYDELLLALLERYNLGTDDPIVRIDTYTVDVPLDPPPRDPLTTRGTRVWSVDTR
jgi:hypothetical protein